MKLHFTVFKHLDWPFGNALMNVKAEKFTSWHV